MPYDRKEITYLPPNQEVIVSATATLLYKHGLYRFKSGRSWNTAEETRFVVTQAYLSDIDNPLLYNIVQQAFTVHGVVESAQKVGRGRWKIEIKFLISYHPIRELADELKFIIERDQFSLHVKLYDSEHDTHFRPIEMLVKKFKVLPGIKTLR